MEEVDLTWQLITHTQTQSIASEHARQLLGWWDSLPQHVDVFLGETLRDLRPCVTKKRSWEGENPRQRARPGLRGGNKINSLL